MINQTIEKMCELVLKMKNAIELDIVDIKAARHENLLNRNDEKQNMMQEIVDLKQELNGYLVEAMKEGKDINSFRQRVDFLEEELRNLYKLNAKLASIVLPVQQMYKDIVDELTAQNGGSIFEIKA